MYNLNYRLDYICMMLLLPIDRLFSSWSQLPGVAKLIVNQLVLIMLGEEEEMTPGTPLASFRVPQIKNIYHSIKYNNK